MSFDSLHLVFFLTIYLLFGVIFYVWPRWIPERIPFEQHIVIALALFVFWPPVIVYYFIKSRLQSW